MWNMIYFYQLISNLSFDQEKELRIRLFCECPKKHISDNWGSKIWLCLYGLDSKTQQELIWGNISKNELVKEEQLKYFEQENKNDEVKIKKEWIKKFRLYKELETIYDDIRIDIENILKVKLGENLL